VLPFKEVVYKQIHKGQPGLLVGDIGGTNSNFGIAQIIKDRPELVFSIHIKSQEIVNFTQVVTELFEYVKTTYDIILQSACFATAGVVTPKQNFCKPTNLNITIDSKEIVKKTGLSCAFIVNDFEVIAYGIDLLNPKDVISIQHGNEFKHGNKAILGAGTGLGKSILRWVETKNRYFPVASEGGHSDFAAQTELDMHIITYIKNHEQSHCQISWEDLLSGKGIERIFGYFNSLNSSDVKNPLIPNKGPHPDEIFKHRNDDKNCFNTFEFYATIYARCAKNWALDTLALGGIYIAGGIAAKNIEMFTTSFFLKEFFNCSKQQRLLKSIPIWVIADYNVSLYGAIEYMHLEGKCKL
jgi:glucokinase